MIIRFYRWLLEEPQPCNNCQVLSALLDTERYTNQRLLNRILKEDIEIPIVSEEKIEPIRNRHVPWKIQREMMEAEDREKAKLQRAQNIEELETELKINGK